MKPLKTNGLLAEQLERRCTRKHRWPDQVSAMASAVFVFEKIDSGLALFTYKCPICKGWHLTKKRQDEQKPLTYETFYKKNDK